MKEEAENALRRTETGRYLVEACRNNPEMTESVESGYADGVRAERERQLAIDRVGGEESLEAAEFLASAMAKARNR